MKSPRLSMLSGLVLCLACGKSETPPAPASAAIVDPATPSPQPAPEPVRVAAASDLSTAFPELGKAFEQQLGTRVEFSFGASGLLAKQLEQGAPFDVFASANTLFVEQLGEKGTCDPASKAQYARGHLVAWSKSDVPAPKQLSELSDQRFKRIAIANPETAPYGKAARQALERAGLWKALEPRVVYAENIRQTLQFAQSGNVEVALVALSLALAEKDGRYLEIDEALHEPIEQALIVCKNGKNREGGQTFAQFVNSNHGRGVMRRFGLLLPGEQLDQPE